MHKITIIGHLGRDPEMRYTPEGQQVTRGPTLVVAMRFWKGDLAPLTDIIGRGERRWKPKHRALAVAGVGNVS